MDKIKNIYFSAIKPLLLTFIFSFLFALSWRCGFGIETKGTIFKDLHNIFSDKFFVLCGILTFILLKILPFAEKILAKINIKQVDELFFKPTKKCFLLCFLFISICHLPLFIAYFPGAFTYDTYHQAHFFFDNNPIEINPFAHNYLVYLTLLFSKKFHTPIWGVFIYTLFQSLITIGAFSYCINFLSKYKTAFWIKALSLLFFALYPSHAVFHLVATKDALFSAFMLLFIIFSAEMIIDKTEFANNKKRVMLFISAAILMMMFRLNAALIYALCLPFTAIYFIKTCGKKSLNALFILIIPILFYAGYTQIKTMCGVIPPQVASSLSVPLQQLGYVRCVHDNILTETDKAVFEEIMPGRAFSYDPMTVDALKVDDDNMHSYAIENFYKTRKKEFWQLYYKWGKEYKKDYVNAFLIMNYPYWYPPYRLEPNDLHYYLFTYNRWNDFWGIKIEERNYLPKLRKLYDRIFLKSDFNRNPVLFFLFSLAVNTWFIIFCLFILIQKRRYDLIISLMSVYVSYITLLCGPMALFRYVYPNFVILPVIWAYCFGKFDEK